MRLRKIKVAQMLFMIIQPEWKEEEEQEVRWEKEKEEEKDVLGEEPVGVGVYNFLFLDFLEADEDLLEEDGEEDEEEEESSNVKS